FNNSLGDVTATTAFTISPDGSCSGASCSASVAGPHTVTGTTGTKTGTASLQVNPGALDHLVLSPASATITAGGSQAYTAEGRDAFNNSLGDETATTAFTVSPDGSCTANSCSASVAGSHTVTGTKSTKTGTASLTVTAATTTHLALSAPATATAETSFAVVLTAKDAANNTTLGYTGTVHWTSSDALPLLPADYTFTAADA